MAFLPAQQPLALSSGWLVQLLCLWPPLPWQRGCSHSCLWWWGPDQGETEGSLNSGAACRRLIREERYVLWNPVSMCPCVCVCGVCVCVCVCVHVCIFVREGRGGERERKLEHAVIGPQQLTTLYMYHVSCFSSTICNDYVQYLTQVTLMLLTQHWSL